MSNEEDGMSDEMVWAILRNYGVAVAVVGFSGGNDSGQADSWDYYADEAQTKPIQLPHDDALECALESPIYDEYGGFAGDYSVMGTVVWDVAVEEHSVSGDYVEDEYDDDYEADETDTDGEDADEGNADGSKAKKS